MPSFTECRMQHRKQPNDERFWVAPTVHFQPLQKKHVHAVDMISTASLEHIFVQVSFDLPTDIGSSPLFPS